MERGHAADIGLRGHGRIRFMSGRAPHRVTGFNLYSMFVAVIGAVVLLVIYHAIARRA